MRLHTLTVQAFGPYASKQTLDFDQLNDAGIFLLTGQTGAGKTTILDAVCFALYGQVPGARGQTRGWRSDLAPDDLAPRVTLEATLRGRRFQIERQPSWDRPKRRGTGMTTVQASVSVSELRDGTWHHVTSRNDEAGDLCNGLLGLTMTQFCQVALLPQGQFQAFLLAKADERQALLQRLFHTERFEDIERWLSQHARELRTQCDESWREVARSLAALADIAREPTPQITPDLVHPDDTRALVADRQHAYASIVAHRVEAAEAAQSAAALDQQSAQQSRERQQQVAERQQRGFAAQRTLAELQESGGLHTAQERLDLARRATAQHAHWQHLDSTREHHAEQSAAAHDSQQALSTHLGVLIEPMWLSRLAPAIRDYRAAAANLQPSAGERDSVAAQHATARDRLKHDHDRVEQAKAAQTQLRTDVSAAEESAQRLASLRDQMETLRTDEGQLKERVEAHRQAQSLSRRVASAHEQVTQTHERSLRCKEHLLELRESRLNGMAGELAAQLTAGGECPVCGSCEHPHRASAETVVSPQDEQAAQRELDTAESEKVAADDTYKGLSSELLRLEDLVGTVSGDELVTRLASVRTELEATSAELNRTELSADALPQLREQLTACTDEVSAGQARCSGLEAEVQQLALRAAHLDTTLETVLGGTGHDNLATLLADLDTSVTLVERALADSSRAADLDEVRQQASIRAHEAATAAGFRDVDDAVQHWIDNDALSRLSSELATLQRRESACRTTLEDPDVSAALALVPVEMGGIDEALADANRQLEATNREAGAARADDDQTQRYGERLTADLDQWLSRSQRADNATGFSELMSGTSVVNQQRIRLSAYAVSFRLAQVIAAANERLESMTGARFELEYTDAREGRQRRAGLGITVLDSWSGVTRPPATLSGGEIFVVSLALALGLADVVTNEAGGAELSTLFVDEGFGALDVDTLEDVLSTLDELRGHGRSVGVVSHVPLMRERIPTHVEVAKYATGSVIR